MVSDAVIAVDIGATSTKAALIACRVPGASLCPEHPTRDRGDPATNNTSRATRAPSVLARADAVTPGRQGKEAVLDCVAGLIAKLTGGPIGEPGDDDPRAPRVIGAGSCGLVDARGRVLETTDTMPGWDGTDIPAELARRTGLACVADNDGNAAALGEATWGVGRGAHLFAMLVLGTGVGGGIALGGEILHGAGSMAGTFGHLCVRPGGRTCACGARGCLEAYASAWAFRRYAGADASEVFARAEAGDPAATRHVTDAARALGAGLAHIAHTLNPQVIAIGGGISRSWHLLAETAMETFNATTLGAARSSTKIAPAQLGPDAGLIGAAVMAFTALASKTSA